MTAAFDDLQPRIEAEYRRLWPIVFEAHPVTERACFFVCEKERSSGYFRELDVMILFVSGWDVEDPYNGGPDEWPRWRGELVHEITHEYEAKVKPEATEQGRELFRTQPPFDKDPHKHDPVFWTSVVAVAQRLGIDLDKFLRLL